ncbi:hypothetical protein [Dyella subtropica]|uniref:hypothetical protein n=1 Tax=Dyella subtropica TaxID=2992127 RepID=UPI00224F9D02|nr:hypothetical protein [Dyella subtropica]
MRVTFRVSPFWILLLALSFAGAFACVVAWFILLSTICSNPRTPLPQTQHVIEYNCHGMKVFISPSQDAMLHWLIPIELVFIFLGFVAAAMVVLAIAKAWQRAKPYRIRIIAAPPGEAPAWVREKWVGLELPLAQGFRSSSNRLTAGVLSGPRSSFTVLINLMRGQYQQRRGFEVSVLEAIALLESTSPDAAAWWRANAPHMMSPARFFLFPEDVCAVVE